MEVISDKVTAGRSRGDTHLRSLRHVGARLLPSSLPSFFPAHAGKFSETLAFQGRPPSPSVHAPTPSDAVSLAAIAGDWERHKEGKAFRSVGVFFFSKFAFNRNIDAYLPDSWGLRCQGERCGGSSRGEAGRASTATQKPQKKKGVLFVWRERSRRSMHQSTGKGGGGDSDGGASPLPPPVKRIITAFVFHFQMPARHKTTVIYWLIMSGGGHRLGRKTEFCICENGTVAKSYLVELNTAKKWFIFVL